MIRQGHCHCQRAIIKLTVMLNARFNKETLATFLLVALLMPGMACAELSSRFRVNQDGTVTDNKTGLMWLENAMPALDKMPIQMAYQFIRALNDGKMESHGYDDWRMPTVEELLSITSTGDESVPFINVQQDYYWSATGGANIIGFVWVVDMSTGSVRREFISYCNFNHVWPVRGESRPGSIPDSILDKARRLPTEVDLVAEAARCTEEGDAAAIKRKPLAPAHLSAVGISSSQVAIAWQWKSDEEGVLFNIYEGSRLIKSASGATTVVIGGLAPGQGACYTVAAYSSRHSLESERSSIACASSLPVDSRGIVLGSGVNEFGQLGDASGESRRLISAAKGLDGVVSIASGVEHAAAITRDGRVWTWGRNSRGQLGDGTENDRISPVVVEGLDGVVDIACGWYHTLALKSDGTVWAWGRNYYGQLGDGTTFDKLRPVKVRNLQGVKRISAGWYHSIAVLGNGEVMSWGWNYKGQLGDFGAAESSLPVKVYGLDNIIDVSAGFYHTAALKSDGTVWAWGRNDYGQLGVGNRKDSPVPLKITGVENAVSVSCGMYYCLALGGDGSVWGWGRNDYGQLGDYAGTESLVGIKLRGFGGIRAVAAGAYHAAAVKSDGSVWTWGWDIISDTKNAPPAMISAAPGVQELAAGLNFTLLLRK